MIIPTLVANELKNSRPNSPGRDAVDADWLRVVGPRDHLVVGRFRGELDPGEAEALALANELKADLLLIDDNEGRQVALRNGLQIVGVLGVLLEAKQRNILQKVAPVLEKLEQSAGFWISPELSRQILVAAGEEQESK